MTHDELRAIEARAEEWADTIELKDPMSRLIYEDVRALVAEVKRLHAVVYCDYCRQEKVGYCGVCDNDE